MMGKYKRGDFVKIEIRDEGSGPSEWLWLRVDHSDDDQLLVFGKLDNEPIVHIEMRLGMELAVSYENVREHMTTKSFDQ
ncbi:MAG TPA: hypothetical protein VK752_11125 [Bryobacteraceae bacterium]|jgi:hypothetical protein|nr:hypothetical protein [Bryobacteraceae bacterium]